MANKLFNSFIPSLIADTCLLGPLVSLPLWVSMEKTLGGDCLLCQINSSLCDQVVAQIQDTIIGRGLFSSRYFCPDDCYVVCSVIINECACDSIRKICAQRQLLPRERDIGILTQISWIKCLFILFFVSEIVDNIFASCLSQFLILWV